VLRGLRRRQRRPTLNGLKLIKTKTSLLGKHYWYQQTFKGLPVI